MRSLFLSSIYLAHRQVDINSKSVIIKYMQNFLINKLICLLKGYYYPLYKNFSKKVAVLKIL